MSHTILLIQPTRKLEARSYGDFESLNEVKCPRTRIFSTQFNNVKICLKGPGRFMPNLWRAAKAWKSAPTDDHIWYLATFCLEIAKISPPFSDTLLQLLANFTNFSNSRFFSGLILTFWPIFWWSLLFDYIDGLTDLSVLVYDKTQSGYSPFNKEWIKVSCEQLKQI